MPRLLLTFVIAGLATLSTLSAMAQPATPAVTEEGECDQLLPYWVEVLNAYPGQLVEGQSEAIIVTRTPYLEMAAIPSDELGTAANYIDAYRAELEAIDSVPVAASGLHDAYLARLVLLSRIIQAHAEGRILDAMAYTTVIERNADTIRSEANHLRDVCGDGEWVIVPIAYEFMWSEWRKGEEN